MGKDKRKMNEIKAITINEAAERLNVSRRTIARLIQSKKLKAIKLGESKQSSVRILESDLKEYLQTKVK